MSIYKKIYQQIVDENITTKQAVRKLFRKEFHEFAIQTIANLKKKAKKEIAVEWAYFNKPLSERKKYVFELKFAGKTKLPFDFFYNFKISYNYYEHSKKQFVTRRSNDGVYYDYNKYTCHHIFRNNFFYTDTRRLFFVSIKNDTEISGKSNHYQENSWLSLKLPTKEYSKIKKIAKVITFLRATDNQQACECLYLQGKGGDYDRYFQLIEGFLVKGRHFKKKRGCETLEKAIELERKATALRVDKIIAQRKSFAEMPDFLVSYNDSLKVGNCAVGTDTFIRTKLITYLSTKLNKEVSFEEAKNTDISIKELLSIQNDTYTRRLLTAKK